MYINGLLTEINHSFAIVINRLSLSSSSFADDISLLALYPNFYGRLLRLQFKVEVNKWSSVTFGEDKGTHCTRMNEREWKLGFQNVDEPYEYKNLGVTKNYIGSSVSDVNDNIEKTRKEAGMIFSSSFDPRKVNPLIYVKFWRQACIPSLLQTYSSWNYLA